MLTVGILFGIDRLFLGVLSGVEFFHDLWRMIRRNMKILCFFAVLSLLGCDSRITETESVHSDSAKVNADTLRNGRDAHASPGKTYSNARFKDVTVAKTGANHFTIEGKAQIFEANVEWVVEDGHYELKKGFETADAGAPEWGKFRFTVDVQKQRPNSTLTLVLFETSMKDGSRQHELPIPLK